MKKILRRQNFLLILIIAILCTLRIYKIWEIPIFLDEATYLSFADAIRKNPFNLFLSFPYAVLPVLPLFLALPYLFFGNFFNIFLVSRILLASTDIVSGIFIFFIGKELIDKKFGLLALIFYLLIPLNFFHGRLVMLEPLMQMLFLLGLYFLIKVYKNIYVRKWHFRYILASSLFLGLSFLTKPLALVSFGSLLFIPPFFALKKRIGTLRILEKITPALVILGLFVLFILPFVIVIFPMFENYHSGSKNVDFALNFKQNLWRSYWWIKAYFPAPILAVLLFSSALGLLKRNWFAVWFLLWALSVIFLDSLVGTKFFPRHLFPVATPASFLLAYLVHKIIAFRRSVGFLLFGLVMILLLQKDLLILSDAKSAGIALEDKQQFYEDWTSGVGLAELGNFLNSVSRDKKITLFVEGDTLLTWALPNIYLRDDITVRLLPNPLPTYLNSFIENGSSSHNFIIFNKTQDAPEGWPVFLVLSLDKGPHRKMNLYKYNQ